MQKKQLQKNIFADKATLILRKMLHEPARHWVMRDFTDEQGVSLGLAHKVVESMAQKGYVERVKKGRDSYTVLTYPDKLIRDWCQAYQFEWNAVSTYYTHESDILHHMKPVLEKYVYALTLHTGANLLTSFVKTDDVYIYLATDQWDKDILSIRQQFDLKELTQGGNIHFIKPFYKTSVFVDQQRIEGYAVVSPLQLFLDLYQFQPRGREHAEFLKKSNP